MKRASILTICISLCTILLATPYSIVFNSGNGDSSSKTTDIANIILSASNNCVDEIITANYIYRAKEGYGIKGGTSSGKGEIILGLNCHYHITTLTVYAACYANKTDSTKEYGISVCGQEIKWDNVHRTKLQPYTITIDREIDSISICANNAKNNRWYVSKIEFNAINIPTDKAFLQLPYKLDLGSQALVDGEPINDVTNIAIKGENIVGDIALTLTHGTHFSLTQTTLPADGGELNLAYTLDYTSTVRDTLIVSAKGQSNIVTIRMPIELSGYIYQTPVFNIDSSCMAIGNMPGFYYANAQGLTDSILKSALGDIIACGMRYKYGSGTMKTWDGFYHTDRDTISQQVLDMYSNNKRYFNPSKPNNSVIGLDIEHMLPKSWWGGDVNEAYCDLFHLAPADYSANRSKSNHAPGVPSDTTFWNGSFATGSGSKYGLQKVFCPADEYKGDFARAYFYIVTCYGDSLEWAQTGDVGMAMTNNHWQEFQPWLRDLLVEWHRNDPVSNKEKLRAIEINKIQGNRNPFIDYPQLVEYIWGDKQGEMVDFYSLTQSFGHQYGQDNTTTQIPNTANPHIPQIQKIIRNNTILILKNGTIYTVLGNCL